MDIAFLGLIAVAGVLAWGYKIRRDRRAKTLPERLWVSLLSDTRGPDRQRLRF